MNERVLVVMPSWVGDVVMATPALRLLRDCMPNTHIAALLRPGLEEILDGAGLVNRFERGDARGLTGPMAVARSIHKARYGSALLLTNSFSTALATWLANIPCRMGYARDGRRPLLTDPLYAPRTGRSWALVPAVRYYYHAAEAFLGGERTLEALPSETLTHAPLGRARDTRLELGVTPMQERRARAVLDRGGIRPDEPYAIVNPGGNNPAKRWPAERFAALADHLSECGLRVLINGAPGERELVGRIAARCRSEPVRLCELNMTLGALKAVVRGARVLVTNDTGPRHIAAAFGVPMVSLFGPTDPRWTTIPVCSLPDGSPSEIVLIANRELPIDRTSNDDPTGSRMERIALDEVIEAVDRLLETARPD